MTTDKPQVSNNDNGTLEQKEEEGDTKRVGDQKPHNDDDNNNVIDDVARDEEEASGGGGGCHDEGTAMMTRSSADPKKDDHNSDDGGVAVDDVGCIYRFISRRKYLNKLVFRYPRINGIVFGVILPLFFIIFLSIFFGCFLALAEAPNEITANDDYLSQRAKLEVIRKTSLSTAESIPEICYELFFTNNTNLDAVDSAIKDTIAIEIIPGVDNNSPAIYEQQQQQQQQLQEDSSQEEITFSWPTTATTTKQSLSVIVSQLHEWMGECSSYGNYVLIRTLLGDRYNNVTGDNECDIPALSFNWIRCYPGASGNAVTNVDLYGKEADEDASQIIDVERNISNTPSSSINYDPSSFLLTNQADFYSSIWHTNQQLLYKRYLAQILKDANMEGSYGGNNYTNVTLRRQAEATAYLRSIDGASGGFMCDMNIPAAGWFWFITMTTIGYGNAVPETYAGRTMLFVLGFLSLLVWGGILTMAGYVADCLGDDSLHKLKMKALTTQRVQVVSCIVWGLSYYIWSLLIGAVVMSWKRERLGDNTFTLKDGYWFGFISSTTIGYGDIYLESEVLRYSDLFTFPLLFLVGFVYFAAFISNLVDVLKSYCGKRSIVEDMMKELEKTTDSQ